MTHPIPWNRLPEWVPGQVLLASDALDWSGVGLRAYRYASQEVIVPEMADFMIVGYRDGITPMRRRFDGRLSESTLTPRAISLLTRAERVEWSWDAPIEVAHIYLSRELVCSVASEALGCAVETVTLFDILDVRDPVLNRAVETLAFEASQGGLGGSIFAESVARCLIVHLLRKYADIRRLEPEAGRTLSSPQRRTIEALVEDRLGERLELETLAQAVGLTPCVFLRLFRASFDKPPHAYLIERRVARAQQLLRASTLPIKEIALDTGFSDQSHLTRVFRKAVGTTPARYRRG